MTQFNFIVCQPVLWKIIFVFVCMHDITFHGIKPQFPRAHAPASDHEQLPVQTGKRTNSSERIIFVWRLFTPNLGTDFDLFFRKEMESVDAEWTSSLCPGGREAALEAHAGQNIFWFYFLSLWVFCLPTTLIAPIVCFCLVFWKIQLSWNGA